MADWLAHLVTIAVATLLVAGVLRQFVRVGRAGRLFDALGLVPQWRFFAQSDIAGNEGCFTDPHVLVRTAGADGTISGWQPVFWLEERKAVQAVWNPARRRTEQLLEFLQVLGDSERRGTPTERAGTIPYLAILRLCLESRPLAEGERLQFAVATTQGRDGREAEPQFVSAWHVP